MSATLPYLSSICVVLSTLQFPGRISEAPESQKSVMSACSPLPLSPEPSPHQEGSVMLVGFKKKKELSECQGTQGEDALKAIIGRAWPR